MTAAATDVVSRPISPAASRQAWRELPVRVASLVTIGVAIVVLTVGGRALEEGLHDRKLIKDGIRVTTTLDQIEGATRAARTARHKIRLAYNLPTDPPGSDIRVLEGENSPMPGELVTHQTKIDVFINPDDLNDWTDRVEPPSWLVAMSVPLLLSPLLILMVLFTLWQRSRLLRLYRAGVATPANVVEIHKSALLPSGRVMKVAPISGGGRVLRLTRPNALGEPPRPGEQVEVIVDDASTPKRAVLAAAYV